MTLPREKPRPRRGSARLPVLLLSLAGLAVVVGLLPFPGGWIERYYSGGIYPVLQRRLTSVSNLMAPFAVGDLLAVAISLGMAVWWIHGIRTAVAGARVRRMAELTMGTVGLTAIVYLAFMGLWGLNYRREPLTKKLDYDEARVTELAQWRLARLGIERLNEDSSEAHGVPWPDGAELVRVLGPSFEATLLDLEGTPRGAGPRGVSSGRARRTSGGMRAASRSLGFLPALPKASLLQPYLQAAGVAGFTNPFGHEVILDASLLPFERPFTLAHEWAHLAGFADESEANFVAVLACARSESVSVRYSGWLTLYHQGHLAAQKPPLEERGLEDARPRLAREEGPAAPLLEVPEEVEADSRAISARVSRHRSPGVSKVGWVVYDRYLKANRVREGVDSYSQVVRLLLGTGFDRSWTPMRRPDEELPVARMVQPDPSRVR